ncbi:hypothetical protein [Lentzea guizhouensis]|uniref:hypothetical protein n=1 Tax=Lentzea guizhouensis TaxID=1586287 RepID=UPI0012B68CF2|nr:hypothetical protein [Lentzea guizhouensis]
MSLLEELTPYGQRAPEDVQAFIEKFTPVANTVAKTGAESVAKAIGPGTGSRVHARRDP